MVKLGIPENAAILSVLAGLPLSVFFMLVFSRTSLSVDNFGKMVTLNMQIDAVLMGFSATVFVYALRRFDFVKEIPNWALPTALAVLFSYTISFVFGFICLYDVENLFSGYAFIPFSFTLSGILYTTAFLQLAVIGLKEKSEQFVRVNS